MISILLVYRTRSWCLELDNFLNTVDGLHIVGFAKNEDELLAQLDAHQPDVVLLTSYLPRIMTTLHRFPTFATVVSLVSGLCNANAVAEMEAVGCVYSTPVTDSLIDFVRSSVWQQKRSLATMLHAN